MKGNDGTQVRIAIGRRLKNDTGHSGNRLKLYTRMTAKALATKAAGLATWLKSRKWDTKIPPQNAVQV